MFQAAAPPAPGRSPLLRTNCLMVLRCWVQDACSRISTVPQHAQHITKAYAGLLVHALNAHALLPILLDYAVAQGPRALPLEHFFWYAALVAEVSCQAGTIICQDARLVDFLVATLLERGWEVGTGSAHGGRGESLARCAPPSAICGTPPRAYSLPSISRTPSSRIST